MSDDSIKVESAEGNREITPRVDMDLPTARRILETVVSIHENSFTSDSPFDRVDKYSTQEVRTAIKTVSLDILNTEGAIEGPYTWITTKSGPYGNLEIALYKNRLDNNQPSDEYIYADLNTPHSPGSKSKRVLSCKIPFREPRVNWNLDERAVTGFFDSGETDSVNDFKRVDALNLAISFKLTDFRFMWLGLRWMCANLLDWDKPKIIMPEELNNPALSSQSQITTPTS